MQANHGCSLTSFVVWSLNFSNIQTLAQVCFTDETSFSNKSSTLAVMLDFQWQQLLSHLKRCSYPTQTANWSAFLLGLLSRHKRNEKNNNNRILQFFLLNMRTHRLKIGIHVCLWLQQIIIVCQFLLERSTLWMNFSFPFLCSRNLYDITRPKFQYYAVCVTIQQFRNAHTQTAWRRLSTELPQYGQTYRRQPTRISHVSVQSCTYMCSVWPVVDVPCSTFKIDYGLRNANLGCYVKFLDLLNSEAHLRLSWIS